MTPAINPETLARIAGLPGTPAGPTHSAAAPIDAQTEYSECRVPLAGIELAALSDRFSVVVRDTWGLCPNAAHTARSS